MKLKKCKKCGSNTFIVQETLLHEAALCPNDKELTVYKERGCGIERVICKNCNEDYSEKDFRQINFK